MCDLPCVENSEKGKKKKEKVRQQEGKEKYIHKFQVRCLASQIEK